MLRLVHAFCEAAPMLLLQLHVLAGGLNGPTSITRTSSLSSLSKSIDDRGGNLLMNFQKYFL